MVVVLVNFVVDFGFFMMFGILSVWRVFLFILLEVVSGIDGIVIMVVGCMYCGKVKEDVRLCRKLVLVFFKVFVGESIVWVMSRVGFL